jgi:nucleoid-associated protein YgaU
MRRTALSLLLAITISSAGCSLFQKKITTDTWSTSENSVATTTFPQSYIPPIEPYRYTAPVEDYPTDEMVSMPAGSLAAQDSRYHVVAPKETLFSLARSYYSDQRRWKEIYAANADTIGSDPNRIYVGQKLRIP